MKKSDTDMVGVDVPTYVEKDGVVTVRRKLVMKHASADDIRAEEERRESLGRRLAGRTEDAPK